MTNKVWLLESPVKMIEGEEIAFSVEWSGAAHVDTPASKVFKNGADISGDVMTSGDADTVSGNIQTLKRITALNGDGGSRYVVEVSATVDNNLEKRKLLIQVIRPGDEG
jgi:hypothetical protein